MNCTLCGKPRGLLGSFFGSQDHPVCVEARRLRLQAEETARKATESAEAQARKIKELAEKAAHHQAMLEMIARGEFVPLNQYSEMLLNNGETLCLLLKGCWSTLFYARAAGRILPGQAVRVDGLKKVDFGSLHVTDSRICFIGKGGAKTIQLKKLLKCDAHGDTLQIVSDGRASSAYFIIESPEALELAHAAILKLAEQLKQEAARAAPRKRRI